MRCSVEREVVFWLTGSRQQRCRHCQNHFIQFIIASKSWTTWPRNESPQQTKACWRKGREKTNKCNDGKSGSSSIKRNYGRRAWTQKTKGEQQQTDKQGFSVCNNMWKITGDESPHRNPLRSFYRSIIISPKSFQTRCGRFVWTKEKRHGNQNRKPVEERIISSCWDEGNGGG